MSFFLQSVGSALRAPSLFILAFSLMLASNFIQFKVLGFNFTGWAWFGILVWSIVTVALNVRRTPALPLWIWAPWAIYAMAWAFHGYPYAWQSTAQILCPLAAGIAASTYPMTRHTLTSIRALIRLSYIVFFVAVLVIVIPFSLRDLENSGFPAVGISSLIFQSFFLGSFLLHGRKPVDLIWYLSAVSIPLLSANRGPLLASVGLLVFAVMPLSLFRRALIFGLACLLGLGAFYTPKLQHKMFHSGQGSLADLRIDNPDLNTSGRIPMWEALLDGIQQKPWLGHGANADRSWLLGLGFHKYLPHNDWLRLLFNYGVAGTLLFAGSMVFQVLHARRLRIRGQRDLHALGGAAATCFVAYALLMMTDNVLIYCQFFTVPMMMLLGATYVLEHERKVALRLRSRSFGQRPRTLATDTCF